MQSFWKPVKWKSKKYSKFVSRRPSMLSGRFGYNPDFGEQLNDPHHYRKGTDGGTSKKPSDVWQVPLTHDEHVKVENGEIVLDPEQVYKTVINQLNDYLVENGVK